MSNAAGRLTGTILSGVLYTYAGNNKREGAAQQTLQAYCF
jgi:hypothetical protein